MKLSLILLTLLIAGSAHANNIIRADAPIRATGSWFSIDPLISQWVVDDEPTDCGFWTPDLKEVYQGSEVAQSRECTQVFTNTSQPRKQNSLTGKIQDDGPPSYGTKREPVTQSQQAEGQRPILNHFTITVGQVSTPEGCTVPRRGFALRENCVDNVITPGAASETMIKVSGLDASLRRMMLYKFSKKCQVTMDLNDLGSDISAYPAVISLTFAGQVYSSSMTQTVDNGAHPVIRYMHESSDVSACNALYNSIPEGAQVSVSVN